MFLGGESNDIGGNAKLGGVVNISLPKRMNLTVHFLKLSPTITVVTNIEDDHLDFYGTREKIKEAFTEYILKTSPDAFAVVCIDDPGVESVVTPIAEKVKLIKYGFSAKADYRARDLHFVGFKTKFKVEHQGKVLGEIELRVPGRHNVYNALAAIAVGMECGLSFC